ncbi:MAG: ATP-dependent zinc metalloprotease FtsH [Chloroflexota bacterium]
MNTPPDMKRPSNRPGPGGTPPSGNARPRLPRWAWWLMLAALIAWNAYALLVPKAPPEAQLTYSDFLTQVRGGNVAGVIMSGQNVDGTFKKPFSWPPNNQSTPNASGGAQPQSGTYTRFNSVLPPNGDPRLVPLLEDQGVSISAHDLNAGSWLWDVLITVMPLLFLVGLLVFMGRQTQRGQQSIFGFGGSKARLYNRERPGITFADVAGEEEAKRELQEVVDFLKRPERYRALGARLPRGVLLVGPPGTGKTLLARAVAGEAAVSFFNISASEFVEMFVGVGASRVRDLFTKAKAEPAAIIFVDEIDAVGRQRGTGLGGGNDEREQTLNQLLVEMDGFDTNTNVIVLAATNRPDVLDPALLRPGRFDRTVTVGLPDRTGREAILRIHTRPLRLGTDVNLDLLARRTPGFSGADLANLANEAALSAARRGATQVLMRDFDEAMDKIVLGTKRVTLMSEQERRVVAYHEGGHAMVARLTPGADPINKVTIIPHGRALGITEQLPEEDRHNYTRDYLLGRVGVMMGGRAAEELVFNQPSTGAENDLKQATNLVRRMVGLWGMSDDIGPVSYGIGETHPFLGRDMAQPREYAESTAAELDLAVRRMLEQAYDYAYDLVVRYRPALDLLVEELMVRETVDAHRLEEIMVASVGEQRKVGKEAA